MSPLRGLGPDHPLFDLQTLAALVLGQVLLEAACDSEDQAAQIVAAVREVDPEALCELLADADDRPVGVRARLGPVVFQTTLGLLRALSLVTHDARLLPDEPAPWTIARDHGRLRADPAGLAERWTIVDREAPARPELDLHEPIDPAVVELIAELRAAIERALGPGAVPADAARVAVRRRDGRIGLRLALQAPASAIGPACEAAAACVAARVGHDRLRLAPDALWDVRMDPELVLWPIVSSAPRLPRGAPGAWRSWLAPGPLAAEIDLELLAPDDQIAPIAAALRADDLIPGDPRRATTPAGLRRAEVLHAVGLQAPDVEAPWRALPGVPVGLELLRDDLDLHPHRGPARWFLRARDALADRDLVEEVTPRATERADRRLAEVIVAALQDRAVEPAAAAGDRWLRPVHDTQGRAGVELLLARLRDEGEYTATLDALGFADDDLEPLAIVGFGPSGLCVHLWYRHGADAARPRVWRPAP